MIEDEQRYRASAYGLLAALLRATPDQALLDHVATLSPQSDDESDVLSVTMGELAQAAKDTQLEALDDEFQDLFIGLGSGEVVPLWVLVFDRIPYGTTT